VLSAVGVDTFVDPRISGGRMNETTPKDLVRVHSLDGKEWLFYDAVVPDVAIIRATTAGQPTAI
jgi:acyl CoA:acetate/3-ketoacid CoA transferase